MLRQSSHRLLVAFICCVLCLTAGALPATALPNFDSSLESRFEPGSWLVGLWRLVGEPVVSLFAPDGSQPPPVPIPPTTNSGIEIIPDGVPGP